MNRNTSAFNATTSALMVLLCSSSAFALPVGTSSFSGWSQSTSNTFDSAPAIVFNEGASAVGGGLVSNNRFVGSAESYSESDLSKGTLRASSTVTGYDPSDDINASASTSRAQFGDSFSHTDGSNQPFLFSNGEQATFSIDISGVAGSSNNVSNVQSEAYLNIFILDAGTLAGNTDDNGNIKFVDESFNGSLFNDLIDFGSYGLTSTSTMTNNYDATGGPASPAADNPFVQVPVDGILFGSNGTLNFSFNPNGDFDWVIELITLASVSENFGSPLSGAQSAISDFSNTIVVDYVAPSGVNVASASGVFPNTVSAVPVPAAAWLFLSALGGLAGLRARGKSQ